MAYNFIWFFGNAFLRLFLRFKVVGKERVPAQGGIILVSNHQSYLDPVAVGCATPRRRPVHFMARESLFKNPIFAWGIRSIHAFPVKRGGADRQAWRAFEKMVADGEVVSFFPEGTRSEDGQLLPANAGAGMLIHRCKGAHVVPVRVRGTHRVLNKAKGFQGFRPVSVVFGDPLDLSAEFAAEGSREVYEALANKVMAGIAALPGIEGRNDDVA
jgi:1-acyl-sn-glycerol-3-phosphate acyltransferase